MGVPKRAYARHRGVSEAAVRKAVLDGRIPANADGSIEIGAADIAWDANSDAVRTKAANHRARGAQGAHRTANASLVRQVLAEEGQKIEGDALSLTHVRMAVGILKAREQARENSKVRGKLIEIEEVGRVVESEYATVRANLMAMPGDVADDLVGLGAIEIEELLSNKIAEILNELSADGNYSPDRPNGDGEKPGTPAPAEAGSDPMGGHVSEGRKRK